MEDGTLTLSFAAALLPMARRWAGTPQVLVAGDNGVQYIAKLSLSTDTFPIVGAGGRGMELARRVGVPVPDTRPCTRWGGTCCSGGFDRPGTGRGGNCCRH